MFTRFISLCEAQRFLPGRNGQPLSIKAIRRRCHEGVHGVRLRFVRNGHDLFTTEQWIEEFLQASTGEQVERIDSGRGHSRAMETLQRYGLQHEKMSAKELRKRHAPARTLRGVLPAGVAHGPRRQD